MIQTKRTLVQTLSLLALHSSWGPELKFLCNPVLSCHSCALAWFACPVGVFAHYSAYHLFPLLAVGMVLLVGALFGRLLCGWVCPFGFLQDLLHKIPTPKISIPQWTSYIKYAVLILMVFLFPYFLGELTQLSFCRYCPASALQVTVPNLVGGTEFTPMTGVKLGILAAILLLVLFSSRAFCRILCPIGALLAPLNHVSLWTVKVPKAECLSCQNCDQACPTDVTPSVRIEKKVPPNRALDCIVCHQCQPPCPQFGSEEEH